MPKAVLSNLEKAEEWLTKVIRSPEKYDFYFVTLENKLVLLKNRSTDPMLHAEVEHVDLDEAQKLADKFDRHLMTLKEWAWSSEQATGGPGE